VAGADFHVSRLPRFGDQIVFEIADNRLVVVRSVSESRFKKYVGRYRLGRGNTSKETDARLRKLRGHKD